MSITAITGIEFERDARERDIDPDTRRYWAAYEPGPTSLWITKFGGDRAKYEAGQFTAVADRSSVIVKTPDGDFGMFFTVQAQ